ncbi:MAG: PP2C family protein-serine/threonine phosphatase, partial [Acidimicrobiia bacterium]
ALGTAAFLLLVHRSWRPPMARGIGTAIAVAVVIVSAVYLVAYRLTVADVLPRWLRPGGYSSDLFAGLPASNTAFALLLIGVALPLLATNSRRVVLTGQVLAATAAALGGRIIVEFFYGSRTLSSFPWALSEMAVTSALCLLALGGAAVLSRWDVGVVSALVGTGPGGLVLRRSLPAVLLMPVILLGFVQGQHLINRPSLFGLLAVVITVIVLVMLMSLARTLDRRDSQRAIATERALRARDALSQRAPVVTGLERQLSTVEPIKRDDVEVHAESRSESGVLTGDAYAIVNLEGSRIGLVLVDVAGHGAEPAVVALRIKDSLIHSLRQGSSPAQALGALRPLLEETEEMATAVVGEINAATGHLRCAVAGHPPPLVIRSDAVDTLESTGPLLHSSIGGTWSHHELSVAEGDTLMLYTDGLTERPLANVARQMREAPSLTEMVNWLTGGETGPAFRDDVSLILLRRLRVKQKTEIDVPDSPAHAISQAQSRFFLETR